MFDYTDIKYLSNFFLDENLWLKIFYEEKFNIRKYNKDNINLSNC